LNSKFHSVFDGIFSFQKIAGSTTGVFTFADGEYFFVRCKGAGPQRVKIGLIKWAKLN
jgi:hypothetical protein